MMNVRTLAICAVGVAAMARGLDAQPLSAYRNFELGSDVASVAARAGVAPAEAKMIHQRPAALQNLEWRPSRWIAGSMSVSGDPVEKVAFSFYQNQLFRIVVDYAHERTEGMTRPDMIDAIAAIYGTPLLQTSGVGEQTASRLETGSGSPVARWGDADNAVVLYQTSSYGSPFRLIVTNTALTDLARRAEAEAVRLDEVEAPQRETARLAKERDEGRAADAKARVANKGAFRP